MNPDDIQIMMNTDPFALAAKYLFYIGSLALYGLCVFRHKMGYLDAVKALVGFIKVPNRDWVFNFAHIGLLVGFLVLMSIAIQRTIIPT